MQPIKSISICTLSKMEQWYRNSALETSAKSWVQLDLYMKLDWSDHRINKIWGIYNWKSNWHKIALRMSLFPSFLLIYKSTMLMLILNEQYLLLLAFIYENSLFLLQETLVAFLAHLRMLNTFYILNIIYFIIYI